MQTARIPPADPTPATITAAPSMHAGHICPPLNFQLFRSCQSLLLTHFFSFGVLSGFTRLIASFSRCQWNALFRLLQEMFNDWDHSLRFRKQGEVAGGRDYGELGGRDELDSLNGVLNADKIVISEND